MPNGQRWRDVEDGMYARHGTKNWTDRTSVSREVIEMLDVVEMQRLWIDGVC